LPTVQLHVVAHTHWDREWYRDAGRFRQRLVPLIDELLDDPPAQGQSFLLDYLGVRPERAAELATLLHDGRLEAGPWYVLGDELIPSAEALVRNLLAGRESLRRLRAESPPVLYCPDSFGHPAVLPDLARGFGADVVVLWRGYGGARWPGGDVVRWRGAAGAEVLLYHLPPDGYEFGSSLPTETSAAAARWVRLSSTLVPRAATEVILLLNGADHHARQTGQAAAVATLGIAARPVEVQPSSLRRVAAALVDAAPRAQLFTVCGELRDSYGYTWTLQGTLATRAAQKRRNAYAERRLVRDVEPWLALAPEGSATATRALLRTVWRELLLAHPHDTLCGTAIDAVASACDARLRAVMSQSAGLREDAILTLLAHDRDHARSAPDAWRPSVVLRNPVPRPRRGVAELTLSAKVADVAVGPGSGSRQGARQRVPAWKVDGIPVQILERRERVALTEAPRAYPDADVVVEARAVGWVESIGGFVIETRAQSGGSGNMVPSPVSVEDRALDNGLLRADVGDDGAVRLLDHRTGVVVHQLIRLERERDLGDLYTPAIRERLPAPTVRRIRVVHRGPLRGEIAVDFDLREANGTRAGQYRLSLQLDAALPVLRVVVHGENRATDHRLRIRFATALAGAETLADAAFHPVVRTLPAISDADAGMEQLVRTAPLHRWVTRFGADRGATIISDGLAEYQSGDDGSVAVTLLRAVGELSRHDLPERPGHAGWPAPTPAAQSLGAYEAVFGVAMHGPDSPATRELVERLSDDLLVPITGETLRSNLAAPQIVGGCTLEGDGLAFSAAMPAQREGWIVLRCVNRRDEPIAGRWTLRGGVVEAHRARLDETPTTPLTTRDGTIEFEAAGREVVTIVVKPHSRPSIPGSRRSPASHPQERSSPAR
jgi:mannosylglycerate hydrolase